jgi:hypothetical protein
MVSEWPHPVPMGRQPWGTMRRSWVGLGLWAIGLVAGCSTGQPAPEGMKRRSPQTLAGATVAWTEPIEVARGPARQGPWRMND